MQDAFNNNNRKTLRDIISKYSPILNQSIKHALTEDLFKLIIENEDDKNFELKDMLKETEKLENLVLREYVKINSQLITKDLSKMKEKRLGLVKLTQSKLEF